MNSNFDIKTFIDFVNDLTFKELMDMFFIPVLILIGFLTVGFFINKFINSLIEKKFNQSEDASLKYVIITSLRGLPRTWCIVTGIYWSINALTIAAPVVHLLSYIIYIFITMTIAQVLARAAAGVFNLYVQHNDNISQTSLLNNIISGIIYAIGIMISLEACGISVTPILTALGVGGMAVALALQDTLSNVFAGIHLMIARQIRIGDYIRINSGEEGRVTDISWRYTTIMEVLGNAIIIPNNKILSAILVNFSNPKEDMIVKMPIGVSYDSDLEHVERVTLEVARAVTAEVDPDVTQAPKLFFHTFADSSIDFNVLMHISEVSKRNRLKHEFIKALTKRYREEGIDIPFPIRTVYKHNIVQDMVLSSKETE